MWRNLEEEKCVGDPYRAYLPLSLWESLEKWDGGLELETFSSIAVDKNKLDSTSEPLHCSTIGL